MKNPAKIWLALALLAGATDARAGDGVPVVVELFTSQACPACPPAEAYLRELAGRGDVIAMEFHIDYYDYAGWKDPFGSADHTRRWQAYARALGARYEYTPFMVVGGMAHVVGSNRGEVEARIRDVHPAAAETPRMTVENSGGNATVRIDGSGPPGIYDIILVTYDRERKTLVAAGENRGKTLIEANVVRRVSRVGQWAGAPVALTAALPEMDGAGGCAVLLQRAGGGPIVAAASFALGG